MAQAIQSVFGEIIDFVYPNNCVICNKLVNERQNCICKPCLKSAITFLEGVTNDE